MLPPMKTNLKKQKECKIKLSVEIDAAEIESCYQEVLRGVQGQATLAGFRQGKAPLDLVQKKFTREIDEEVLKSLIPETYHRAVQKHGVSPVSLPSISDIKMERGRHLKFEAEFETEPEFVIRNYKGVKIRKVPVDVGSDSQRIMKDELVAKLLESVKFEVPEGLATQQKQRLLEQARQEYQRMGLPPERFEADRGRLEAETAGKARDQVKLFFILKKIADNEKIEVDEIELEAKLKAIADGSKHPVEEIRRVFEEDLRESMREKQTVDFLLANAKLEEPKP